MKAYSVWSDYSEYTHVIFANTAREARLNAYNACDFEDSEYIDIRAKRIPKCDVFYKGSTEGDWYDMELRKVLVEEYGWRCGEPDRSECEECRLCEDWSEEE